MLERDYRRADATAEMQISLDALSRDMFPAITTSADLDGYKSGRTDFASFRLQRSPILPDIIDTALARAADSTDPAFCSHANLHGHFQEVVKDLRESLEARKLKTRIQPVELTVTIGEKPIEVEAHRLVIEAAERIRPTFRPGPHQFFLELQEKIKTVPNQQQDTVFTKAIRRAAGEYGVPFAILVCVYSGLTAKPIVTLFDNEEVKVAIRRERQKAGVKNAKIPGTNTTDHTALHHMIQRIRQTLIIEENARVRPSYFPPDYFEALQQFDSGYLRDFTGPLKEFIQTDEKVTPRAIFSGLDEFAQRSADSKFVDPYRAQYIERTYSGYATTQMITAYFESQVEPSVHHFSHAINGRKGQ